MAHDDAIVRLARQIDAARQSERFLVNPAEVARLRRQGACHLYEVCAEFVSLLNTKLSHSALEIAPPAYTPEMFDELAVNIFQISSQGRAMQITFQATPQLYSTEKFRIPYILEGEVRTYNQKLLERFEVRSRDLFFCIEEDGAVWRFFDWRGPRSAPVDRDLLVSLMQPLF